MVALFEPSPVAETTSGSRAADRGFAEPVSSAGHTQIEIIVVNRIGFPFCKVSAITHARHPVFIAKFKYIPVHIIEPPGVRFLEGYRMSYTAAVGNVPPGFFEIFLGISAVEMSCCSGTACVFLFRFGWQSETVPGKIAFPGFFIITGSKARGFT